MKHKERSFKHSIHTTILCGGSGTRLWPLSRKSHPKQFLSLGGNKKSLLQQSLDRIKNISTPQNTWIVSAFEQKNPCLKQVGQKAEHFVFEPAPRNTAAAIGYAAWQLLQEDENSIMVILPSDHCIQNIRSFEESIFDAITLAEQNLFVTLGIQPTFPATGFGYIEKGLPLNQQGQIALNPRDASFHEQTAIGYSVRSFREKPNVAAAEQFLRTGKYLWNAGIFVWKTSTFWNAFSHIQPEMARQIEQLNESNINDIYPTLENISIDIAFLEQTSHVACVPASFDWSDVGSWNAVRECFQQDEKGNSLSGNIYAHETTGSVIHSTRPFVAVIGMENVSVIATEDAVLVMPLNRSQEVKQVIQYLEQNNPQLT